MLTCVSKPPSYTVSPSQLAHAPAARDSLDSCPQIHLSTLQPSDSIMILASIMRVLALNRDVQYLIAFSADVLYTRLLQNMPHR